MISQRLFLSASLLVAGLLATNITANAALTIESGPGGLFASVEAYAACIRVQEDELCTALAVVVDPIGVISEYHFRMMYDTTRININLANTGFLSDFSEGGDSPPLAGLDNIIRGGILHVGGPRPGTTYSFVVDPIEGALSLDYDMTANPATSADERNVFAIGIDLLFPWSAKVAVSDKPGIYDMYFTGGSCVATIDGRPASCGTSRPAVGIDFLSAPEPSMLAVFVAGSFGFLFLHKRGREKL